MTKRLYIIRIEWSQTDYYDIGTWAETSTEACKRIQEMHPGAHYYMFRASTDKIV